MEVDGRFDCCQRSFWRSLQPKKTASHGQLDVVSEIHKKEVLKLRNVGRNKIENYKFG